MGYSNKFFGDITTMIELLPKRTIDNIAIGLATARENNKRIFCLGIGGSAANCSHFVNDLRKICGIQAYCPTDNSAELSAWANDSSLDDFFINYLQTSNLTENDVLFIMSVGGGDIEKKVSVGLIKAIEEAKVSKALVYSIVGRSNSYVANNSDIAIVLDKDIPTVSKLTPYTEALQGVITHCLVSHPKVQKIKTKW